MSNVGVVVIVLAIVGSVVSTITSLYAHTDGAHNYGEVVTFHATIENSTGVTFSWVFADGTEMLGQQVSRSFQINQTDYSVTLFASNGVDVLNVTISASFYELADDVVVLDESLVKCSESYPGQAILVSNFTFSNFSITNTSIIASVACSGVMNFVMGFYDSTNYPGFVVLLLKETTFEDVFINADIDTTYLWKDSGRSDDAPVSLHWDPGSLNIISSDHVDVSVSPSVDFDYNPQFNLKVRNGVTESVSLGFDGNIDTTLTGHITFKLEYSVDMTKTLISKKFGPEVFFIGEVPIVVFPELSVNLYGDASAGAKADFSAGVSSDVTFLITSSWDQESGFSASETHSHSASIIPATFGMELCSGEVSLSIRPEISLSLYGLASVGVSVGPEMYSTLDAPPPTEAESCPCRGQSHKINKLVDSGYGLVADVSLTLVAGDWRKRIVDVRKSTSAVCSTAPQICQETVGDCHDCPKHCLLFCNSSTYKCYRCDDGYYGEYCEKKCPGRCILDRCDQSSGQCSECEDNFHWGSYCTFPCPENCECGCHKEDGNCRFSSGECGCKNNMWGKRCEQSCPPNCHSDYETKCYYVVGKCWACIDGFYGNECADTCPKHCKGGTCSFELGNCNGCYDNVWWGSKCESKCSPTCLGGECWQKGGGCF